MKSIQNIRSLVVDMVEKANSGHPGAPLGLAPFIYTLYKEYLKLNPDNVKWPGRDIFILSNGHACAIQYVMNYLMGYLTLDDLKKFRQLDSYTPGHPEGKVKGVEVTTGPLGQGVANAVGFAISLKKLGLKNHVYCIFGDGCYMEGISQEAFSITATLGLDNITFVYDFNKITIDGTTALSMCEDVKGRFISLNFHVEEANGEDIEQIRQALAAKATKPKVILLYTTIGKDTIVENSNKAHGSPIGSDGAKKLKEKYGLPPENFCVLQEVQNEWKNIKQEKRKLAQKTINLQIENIDAKNIFKSLEFDKQKIATRKHFSNLLKQLKNPNQILCGSADLSSSCLNKLENSIDFNNSNPSGNFINFGVREHAMCGIANGISAHGYFMPMFSTFLNFVSYGFPSVRLGAFNRLNNVYILTHDSIALGEDGPTHQPIEVLSTLRSTPNLFVFRPCDVKECMGALQACYLYEGPKAIILSRQKVSFIPDTCKDKCQKGGYYLVQQKSPDIILFSTGSEVELCYTIKEKWTEKNISIVSMFSWELFEMQETHYKESILCDVPRISIEAASTFGWQKYTHYQIGIDRFGWSGKGEEVYAKAGFTAEKIICKIKKYLTK